MKNERGKNTAASVRDRLLNLARQRGEDFQWLLTRYGLERLLYRLSRSTYRERFVLKGAMLFLLWGNTPHRPTRDIDFLGIGDSSEAGLKMVFRELCDIAVEDDGLTLMVDSVQVEAIRDVTEYGGVRVKLVADLAGARIPIQIDIGFGDAVTPAANEIEYPTLLDNPAPQVKAYPRETVVAEKYQALVHLGVANSRMKDFYDLWIIAREFDFDGVTLSRAIDNTFTRRLTPIPDGTPFGLSAEFYADPHKEKQWNAFLRKGRLETAPPTLGNVFRLLRTFLLPPTENLNGGRDFTAVWKAGGPWK
ncbi:MAG: nucleotidyl transferase AbiEii/AbiGii toxin family protein [Candidatus Thiodiazotropha lotti]|nr:nucleotidyl transferase AbiEii/AbiGii toxin family protein [Candidatus Thiodiazotropha lotti]